MAPSRAGEAICNARHQVVFTKKDSNVASGSNADIKCWTYGRKELRAVTDPLARIPQDEDRVLMATGKYIGEGFDDPRLDTLFVALPVS